MKAKSNSNTIEDKFATLANLIADPVVIVDQLGHYLLVNEAYELITGYSEKEMLGKSFLETNVASPQCKSIMLENLKKRMLDEPVKPYELDFTDKNGKIRIVEINAKRIDYAGKPADLVILRDITERKTSQELIEKRLAEKSKSLSEKEGKLRSIFNSSPDAIIVIDLNNHIVECNPAALKMYGFSSKDEIIGTSPLDLISPKDSQKAMQIAKELLKSDSITHFELTLIARDGHEVLAECSLGNIKDSAGQPTGFVGITKDVTERRKMEEKLKQELDILEAVTENIGAGLVLISIDYRILWANKLLKDRGGAENEICFSTLNNLRSICPDCGAKKIFEDGAHIDTHEYTSKDKAGTPAWVELISTPIKDKDGKVMATLELAVPITKRKKVEQALKESEERFRAISNSVMDALILIDDNETISYWNPAAEKTFGYTTEEAMGKKATELIVPPRVYEAISSGMEHFKEKDSSEIFGNALETVGLKKDGTEISVEMSCAQIQIGDKNYRLFIARDITEQKRLQKKLNDYSQHLKSMIEIRTMQLKNANDRLVKSERLAAIGELAGMVGHDLRNPLAGMRGATYYLKTKYGEKMADDGKKMLKTIDECISYSDKIINDLLDYSREIRLDLTESTPEQMVKNALAHIEVPERIRLTNTSENGPILKADKEKMIRVFVNLIKNAFDAMPEGGSLKIRNEKAKSKVAFIFEDTGAGMTKETMLKLWTPLFTTKAKGMGFGLAICKRIVEAHGGTISVESTIGEGTKMTVTLPVNPKKVVSSEETWVVDRKVLPLTAIPK